MNGIEKGCWEKEMNKLLVTLILLVCPGLVLADGSLSFAPLLAIILLYFLVIYLVLLMAF